MIVELIVSLIVELIEFVGSIFGTVSMPGWWSEVGDGLTYLVSEAAGFNYWIPLPAAINAVGWLVLVIGIALGIKLVRIIASFFTAGGGSAA